MVNLRSAEDYNDDRDFGAGRWKKIQRHIGVPECDVDGIPGPQTAQYLADYQDAEGMVGDGKFGPKTIAHFQDTWREVRALTWDDSVALMMPTFYHEGGATPYDAMNLDYEYEGLFDKPERPHRFSKFGPRPTHVGLSLGAPQFAQAAGSLGQFLKRAAECAIEDGAFTQWEHAMGNEGSALLEMLDSPTRPRVISPALGGGRRGPCVQPVHGHDLWSPYWTRRFKAASKFGWWKRAQHEIAYEEYFEPMLITAREVGLMGAGDLAVLFDAAINHGVAGMRSRVEGALERHGKAITITHVINEFGPSKHTRRWNAFEGVDWWVNYGIGGDCA